MVEFLSEYGSVGLEIIVLLKRPINASHRLPIVSIKMKPIWLCRPMKNTSSCFRSSDASGGLP